jgi:integrase/recombinase XerD
MNTAEKPASFEAQSAIAKSAKAVLIRRIARLVRQEGLDYEGWRYVAKKIRQLCRLKPDRKGRKLPNVLTAAEFQRFYAAVDRAANAQHALMLRLLFYTGVRVAELCKIEVVHVDLDACRIRINEGKGRKDRVVLFGKAFATALRAYLAALPKNRYLFQTRLAGSFTTRRVEQIVKHYAEAAGVKATPHTFRHQAITWLTRHSGMADAELQLITGHAKRETLAIYQHVALDGQIEDRYQRAMREVEI